MLGTSQAGRILRTGCPTVHPSIAPCMVHAESLVSMAWFSTMGHNPFEEV